MSVAPTTPTAQALPHRVSPKCLPEAMSLVVTPERGQLLASSGSTSPSVGRTSVSPSPIPLRTDKGSAMSAEAERFPFGIGSGAFLDRLGEAGEGGRRRSEEGGLSSESRSATVDSQERGAGTQGGGVGGSIGRRSASTPMAVRETACGVGGLVLLSQSGTAPKASRQGKVTGIKTPKDNSMSASSAVLVSPVTATTTTKARKGEPKRHAPVTRGERLPSSLLKKSKDDYSQTASAATATAGTTNAMRPTIESGDKTAATPISGAAKEDSGPRTTVSIGATPTPSRVLYTTESSSSPSYPRPYRALVLPSGRTTRASLQSNSDSATDGSSSSTNGTLHKRGDSVRDSSNRIHKTGTKRTGSGERGGSNSVPRTTRKPGTSQKPPVHHPRSTSAGEASTLTNKEDMSVLARSNPHLSQLVELLDNKVFTEEDVLLELEAIRKRSLLTSAPFNRHLLPILAFYLLKEKFGEDTANRYVAVLKRPITEAERKGAGTGTGAGQENALDNPSAIPSFLPRVNDIRRERRQNKEIARTERPHLYAITPPKQGGEASSSSTAFRNSPGKTDSGSLRGSHSTALSSRSVSTARTPRRVLPHYSLLDESLTLPSSSSARDASAGAKGSRHTDRPYRGPTTYSKARAVQDARDHLSVNDCTVLAVSVIKEAHGVDVSEAAPPPTGLSAFDSEAKLTGGLSSLSPARRQGGGKKDLNPYIVRQGPAPLPMPPSWPPVMRRAASADSANARGDSSEATGGQQRTFATPGVSFIPQAEDSPSVYRSGVQDASRGITSLLAPPRGDTPTTGTSNVFYSALQDSTLATAARTHEDGSGAEETTHDASNVSTASKSTKAPPPPPHQHQQQHSAIEEGSLFLSPNSRSCTQEEVGVYTMMMMSGMVGDTTTTTTTANTPSPQGEEGTRTSLTGQTPHTPSGVGQTMTFDQAPSSIGQYGSLMEQSRFPDAAGNESSVTGRAAPSALSQCGDYGSLLPGCSDGGGERSSDAASPSSSIHVTADRGHDTYGSLLQCESTTVVVVEERDPTQASHVGYGSMLPCDSITTAATQDSTGERAGESYGSLLARNETHNTDASGLVYHSNAETSGRSGYGSLMENSGRAARVSRSRATSARRSSLDGSGAGYGSLLDGDSRGSHNCGGSALSSRSSIAHKTRDSLLCASTARSSRNQSPHQASNYGSLLLSARDGSATVCSRVSSGRRGDYGSLMDPSVDTSRHPSRHASRTSSSVERERYGSLLLPQDASRRSDASFANRSRDSSVGGGYGSLLLGQQDTSVQAQENSKSRTTPSSRASHESSVRGYGSLLDANNSNGNSGRSGHQRRSTSLSTRSSMGSTVKNSLARVPSAHSLHSTSGTPSRQGYGSLLQGDDDGSSVAAQTGNHSGTLGKEHSAVGAYSGFCSVLSAREPSTAPSGYRRGDYGSLMDPTMNSTSHNGTTLASTGESSAHGNGYGSLLEQTGNNDPSTGKHSRAHETSNNGDDYQFSLMRSRSSGSVAPGAYGSALELSAIHGSGSNNSLTAEEGGSGGSAASGNSRTHTRYGSAMQLPDSNNNSGSDSRYDKSENVESYRQAPSSTGQQSGNYGSLLKDSAPLAASAQRSLDFTDTSGGRGGGYGSALRITSLLQSEQSTMAAAAGAYGSMLELSQERKSNGGGYSMLNQSTTAAAVGDVYGSALRVPMMSSNGGGDEASDTEESLHQSTRYGSMMRHSRLNESEAAVYSLMNASMEMRELPDTVKDEIAKDTGAQCRVRELARLFEQRVDDENKRILYPPKAAAAPAATALGEPSLLLERTGSQFGYSVFLEGRDEEEDRAGQRPKRSFLLSSAEIKQILLNKEKATALANNNNKKSSSNDSNTNSTHQNRHRTTAQRQDVSSVQYTMLADSGLPSPQQGEENEPHSEASSPDAQHGGSSNFNQSAFFSALDHLQVSVSSADRRKMEANATESNTKTDTAAATTVETVKPQQIVSTPPKPAVPVPPATANESPDKTPSPPPSSDAARGAAFHRANVFSMVADREPPSPQASLSASDSNPVLADLKVKRGIGFRRSQIPVVGTNANTTRGRRRGRSNAEGSTPSAPAPQSKLDERNATEVNNVTVLSEPTEDDAAAADFTTLAGDLPMEPVSIMMKNSVIADASASASLSSPSPSPGARQQQQQQSAGAAAVPPTPTTTTPPRQPEVHQHNATMEIPLNFTREVLGEDRCVDHTAMEVLQERFGVATTPPFTPGKGNHAYEARDVSVMNVSIDHYVRCADLTVVLQSRLEASHIPAEAPLGDSVTPERQLIRRVLSDGEEGESPPTHMTDTQTTTPPLRTASPSPASLVYKHNSNATHVFSNVTPEQERSNGTSPTPRRSGEADTTAVEEEGSTLFIASPSPRRRVVHHHQQQQQQQPSASAPVGKKKGPYIGVRPAKRTILHIEGVPYVATPEASPDVDKRRSMRKEREHDAFVARWAMRGLMWKRQEEQAQIWEEQQRAAAGQHPPSGNSLPSSNNAANNYYNAYHQKKNYNGANAAGQPRAPMGQPQQRQRAHPVPAPVRGGFPVPGAACTNANRNPQNHHGAPPGCPPLGPPRGPW